MVPVLLALSALAVAQPRHLDLVSERLELSADERAQLDRQHMLVLDRSFRTYIGGYREVFKHDLPLLVTADSLNFPLHQILLDQVIGKEAERLLPSLVAALTAMEQAPVPAALGAPVRADVGLYLCVARALASQPGPQTLEAGCVDPDVTPKAGAILDELKDGWLDEREVWAGNQMQAEVFTVALHGEERRLDPWAFVPGAPYTDDVEQRWYRASVWLREGAPILSRGAHGARKVDRRAVIGAAWLAELAARPEIAGQLAPIETWMRAVYGPPDGADPAELRGWMAGRSAADLARAQGWEASLGQAGVGAVVAWSGLDPDPELYQRFSLLNPAIALDGVLIATLAPPGERLDLAAMLGALGHEAMLPFAPASQRERAEAWARDLGAMPRSPWTGSLRERWLDAVRALADGRDGPRPGPWGGEVGAARTAQLQLSTWTLLRHDTRLFAPFMSEGGCSFPDVIVEPYPAFYEALAGVAGAMRDLLSDHAKPALLASLDSSERTLLRLRDIAVAQAGLSPLSEADQRWLQGAVSFKPRDEYEGDDIGGWYPSLYWPLPDITLSERISNFEQVVVDVAVRPPGADGAGEVLHLGTGAIRAMVVLSPTCEGLVAAVGPTQEVHAVWTPGLKRLSDDAWTQRLKGNEETDFKPWRPAPPAWLAPLYGPDRPRPASGADL